MPARNIIIKGLCVECTVIKGLCLKCTAIKGPFRLEWIVIKGYFCLERIVIKCPFCFKRSYQRSFLRGMLNHQRSFLFGTQRCAQKSKVLSAWNTYLLKVPSAWNAVIKGPLCLERIVTKCPFCSVSPRYNRNGWLGVKHQVTCIPFCLERIKGLVSCWKHIYQGSLLLGTHIYQNPFCLEHGKANHNNFSSSEQITIVYDSNMNSR